tara:strand:- start:118 stop:477 length:360 start_codon:yes stop_codon:yes gene_type:complete
MLGFWGWYKADNIQLVKERDKLLSYFTEYLSKEIRNQLMEQGADHGEKGFMASVVYIMLEEVNFMTIAELEVEYRTNTDWWRKKLKYKMRNNTIKSHHFHIANLSRKIIEEGKKSVENK